MVASMVVTRPHRHSPSTILRSLRIDSTSPTSTELSRASTVCAMSVDGRISGATDGPICAMRFELDAPSGGSGLMTPATHSALRTQQIARDQ
jgi:hypothetical protein